MMVQNELEQLRSAKEALLLKECELESVRGHKYGLWSKSINGENIVYQRSCIKCNHIEKIPTSVMDLSIERVIKNQNEAERFTNFFCDSSPEELTNENVLLFLAGTTDYQPYMNIDKIIDKIIEVNNGYTVHNTIEENLIFNAVLWLKKARDIPEELFHTICDYLNKLAEERKNNAMKEEDTETKIIEFTSNHSSKRAA